MIRSLPIRIRLTLWYSLAIATAMFTIGFISLWMVHRAINDLENEELQQRVRSVRRFVESRPAGETQAQLHDAITAAYNVSHGNKWLQVIDEQGNWIYRSPHVVAAYPKLVLPQQAPAAGAYFTYTAESSSVRGLIEPISIHGVRYTVQTGLTLNKTLAILSNLRIQLLLLATIGLFVSSLAGHFMSRKVLNPVTVLAAQARRINDRNLDIRLPVPRAKDEIFDLSQTLNQMLERIDKAFASVRTFTGNASHELRTPITLLRTEIEVGLYRPRESEEYRAILRRLHEQTVRMTGLVENLLALARADGGAETINVAPVRVNVLFNQIADTWKSTMNNAMLEFHVETPKDDLVVLCDVQGITRLLSILLENASKYTPPGGVIKLNAAVDRECIVVSVHDSGIGIAVEHRLRIFDRFYRVAPANASVPAGSGLGLALAKWIAQHHGTELNVTSNPGCGSCFSFSLRRSAPALAGIHAICTPTEESHVKLLSSARSPLRT
ncbi:MAG: ATP-binding protein [Terracidiphilus sp.]